MSIHTMDIKKALEIKGFMTGVELTALAYWAMTSKHIIEIGSYMGRSTRALADNTKGTVTAVDDFWGLRERIDNECRDDIRKAFHANLADHLTSGKVQVMEASHDHPALRASSCDMCFIDGSHDFDSVVRDIRTCMTITNGLLCGHDFDVEHRDVMLAVDTYVPGYRVVPGTTLWYVYFYSALKGAVK